MSSLFVEKIGQGPALVMLHGWGFNSGVWQSVTELLSQDFELHLVDLPGFGHSELTVQDYCLPQLALAVAQVVPQKATWLGWSLGGLVAKQAALMTEIELDKLITVACSPCFLANLNAETVWPGIAPDLLLQYHKSLEQDPKKILTEFLVTQALGSRSVKNDIKILKSSIKASPAPQFVALNAGLNLLKNVDLRQELKSITCPWLRLYGKRDALVPRKIMPMVEGLVSGGESYLFKDSAHAPFVSESELFVEQVKKFVERPRSV